MIQPSISIGVVGYPEDGRTSDELMITADASMYRSKHAGRNRVSGVPVMDEEVIGRSATGEPAEAPRSATREPAEATREPADNSV
jgi:predicted signal transduction protein with EAL and GGDEF domain